MSGLWQFYDMAGKKGQKHI